MNYIEFGIGMLSGYFTAGIIAGAILAIVFCVIFGLALVLEYLQSHVYPAALIWWLKRGFSFKLATYMIIVFFAYVANMLGLLVFLSDPIGVVRGFLDLLKSSHYECGGLCF